MPIYDCTPGGGKEYTAGSGIAIQNNEISAQVSQEVDNATGVMSDGLYTPVPIPSAIKPMVIIQTLPATPSITVTGTKGTLSVQGTTDESGIAQIEVSSLGIWAFNATLDGKVATASIPISRCQIYNVTLTRDEIFGVSWEKSNPSTQLSRLSPENDPNGIVTASVSSDPVPAIGSNEGSSPFDLFTPWNQMYVCNINASGEESARQGESGFSYAAPDVMVWIPPFYYHVIDTELIRYYYICYEAVPGFELHPGSGRYLSRYTVANGYNSISGAPPQVQIGRNGARAGITAKGENWFQYDIATYSAVVYLYLIEFADWDIQSAIGMGNVSTSAVLSNGGTDSMAYHTGRAAGIDGQTAVQYRGIENLWGNVWQWIDGIISNGSFYICTNPALFSDTSIANYTSTGITPIVNTGYYITSMGFSEEAPWVFLPSAGGGSATTYIPDSASTSSNAGMYAAWGGGDRTGGTTAGIFYLYAITAYTNAGPTLGARSCCLKAR